MIPFTSGHQYFMYTGLTVMRKGYNGLYGIVKCKGVSGKVYDYILDSIALINVYSKFNSPPDFEYEQHNLFYVQFFI
ncbi:MAG: hypothetical protein IPJ83_09290 [Saprospiraceae bacterium]|nr:hypothetical protein [Candidatus Vicinibacter proximus]MCC6842322.1 hypothetical protein [Saprospiraceae bacterium]